MRWRERVVTYIVREGRFVAFLHEDDQDPIFDSGFRSPEGTIEPGEAPHEGALREAREETRLDGLRVVRYLGSDVFDPRPADDVLNHRHFFQLAVDSDPPREWRHVENNATWGGPYAFRLFWLPLEKAPLLCGGMSALIGRIFDEPASA